MERLSSGRTAVYSAVTDVDSVEEAGSSDAAGAVLTRTGAELLVEVPFYRRTGVVFAGTAVDAVTSRPIVGRNGAFYQTPFGFPVTTGVNLAGAGVDLTVSGVDSGVHGTFSHPTVCFAVRARDDY